MSDRVSCDGEDTEVDTSGGFGVATGPQAAGARRLIRYVLSRIAQAAAVLWLSYTLTFIAISLLPSNPIAILAADDSGVIDAKTVEQMKIYYGYDHSPVVRYLIELRHLLQGGLGYSMSTGQTVAQAIRTPRLRHCA
jgi:peptide/nickel transport system permease protein